MPWNIYNVTTYHAKHNMKNIIYISVAEGKVVPVPSHYLNLCWLPEDNFTVSAQAIIL